jgi:hypothetical protein
MTATRSESTSAPIRSGHVDSGDLQLAKPLSSAGFLAEPPRLLSGSSKRYLGSHQRWRQRDPLLLAPESLVLTLESSIYRRAG